MPLKARKEEAFTPAPVLTVIVPLLTSEPGDDTKKALSATWMGALLVRRLRPEVPTTLNTPLPEALSVPPLMEPLDNRTLDPVRASTTPLLVTVTPLMVSVPPLLARKTPVDEFDLFWLSNCNTWVFWSALTRPLFARTE